MKELQRILDVINAFLEKAPAGYLKIQQRQGKTYYYHQYCDDSTNATYKKYIVRKEEKVAKALAQKGYYLRIKPIIEKQIITLGMFVDGYNEEELNEEFDKLSETRKNLIQPIRLSTKMKIEQWKNEEYEKNQKYSEGLVYETENGEMVRSKSELIISNALLHSNQVLYKYERPITLNVSGKTVVFYPDFTIMNTHTGDIFYWEHAGRMDDSYYADEFVKKMNVYAENGIVQGKNLIVTYETRNCPLSIRSVRAMIATIIE